MRQRAITLLLSAVLPGLAVGGGRPSAVESGEGTVSGRVVLSDGGALEGVAGARVRVAAHRLAKARVEPRVAMTDSRGAFEVGQLPLGEPLTVEVVHPRVSTRLLRFLIPAGSPARDLGEIPVEAGRDLEVVVRGPSREPVRGAEVKVRLTLRDPTSGPARYYDSSRRASERAPGAYALERATTGSLRIEVRAPGYLPHRGRRLQFPADGRSEVELRRGHTIRGVVLDGAGRPLAGATVTTGSDEDEDSATTEEDGRFALTSLAPGRHDLVVVAAGYGRREVDGVSVDGPEVRVALAPESVLGGVVRTVRGEPIAGARVTLFPARYRDDRPGATTDEEGRFSIGGLAAGRFSLSVTHPRHVDLRGEDVELGAGERVLDREVVLRAGLSVSVRVLDARTRGALVGAFVVTGARRIPVEDGGVARLEGLEAGELSLTIRAEGYVTERREVMVAAVGGMPAEVEVLLRRDEGEITGRVLDAAGAPLVGATVTLRHTGGFFGLVLDDERGVRTDERGRYRLTGLPEGWLDGATEATRGVRCFVEARHPARATRWAEVPRPTTPVSTVELDDLRLEPGARIAGRVLSPLGQPLLDVRVTLEGADELPWKPFFQRRSRTATTDREGRYELAGLGAGEVTLEARVAGSVPGRLRLVLVPGRDVVDADIHLGAGETVAGRVVDSRGAPVVGATVRARSVRAVGAGSDEGASELAPTDLELATPTTTDEDGRFTLRVLRRMLFEVVVEKSGLATEVVAFAGDDASREVVLHELGRIRGRVARVGLAEFPRFHVAAVTAKGHDWLRAHEACARLHVREDGSFELAVPAGSYRLWATVPGFSPSPGEEVKVEPGQVLADVEIPLRSSSIVGRVVSSGEAAVADAEVSVIAEALEERFGSSSPPSASATAGALLRSAPFWIRPGRVTTAADGGFSLPGLPAGTYRLRAVHPSRGEAHVEGLRVGEDATVERDVRLGGTGRIVGELSWGGEPLADAEVALGRTRRRVRSDASGRFELLEVPVGEHAVRVRWGDEKTGALALSTWADVRPGAIADASIEWPRVRVSGRLTGGENVASALRVGAVDFATGRMSAFATIDEGGRFELDVPGSGPFRALVSFGGSPSVFPLDIPHGATAVRRDLEVGAGRLEIRVVDVDGEPIGGARVLVSAPDAALEPHALLGELRGNATTARDGRVVIDRLPAGRQRVRVVARGFADRREEVEIPTGVGLVSLRVSLRAEKPARVRFTDEAGVPLRGVVGVLLDDDGGVARLVYGSVFSDPVVLPEPSDRDGTLRLGGLGDGGERLRFFHSEHAPVEVRIEGASDGDDVIVLPTGGRLRATIVDVEGRPVFGARLELTDPSGAPVPVQAWGAPGVSNAEGKARLGPLTPGRYLLTARGNGLRSPRVEVHVRAEVTVELRLQAAAP